jgi:hypothetical protein
MEQLAHTPSLSLSIADINTTKPQPTEDDRASFELDFVRQFKLCLHHKLLSREIAEDSITFKIAIFGSSLLIISQ